jgi:hypothetical protein
MVRIPSTMYVAVMCGLSSLATTARADTFTTAYPVTELHSVGAGNTAGSFVATAVMALQGFSNTPAPPSWESYFTEKCHNATLTPLWPSACDPGGMYIALQDYTANYDWIRQYWTAPGQQDALNEMVSSLMDYHSPVMVPVYGQADHWLVVTQVTATKVGANWNIGTVKIYDGGPTTGVDGSGTSYFTGTMMFSARAWLGTYFMLVTAINPSCDPVGCTSDTYYNTYVLVDEPPSGPRPPISTSFPPAPGVVPAGTMTAATAQASLWKSLSAAGIDGDAQVWNAIQGGTPGAALAVDAVFPSGAPWPYYLVPIQASPTMVLGLALLSADDGSFQAIQALPSAQPFTPINATKARAAAAGLLVAGEALTGGGLRWDPRGSGQLAKSPTHPYYEFGVLHAGKSAGVVRIALDGGAAVRE